MTYKNIHKAKFISRPNRFIAECELDGEIVIAHVKNTGRCRELLVPGFRVYLDEPLGRERKTKYDLVAVEKLLPGGKPLLINMDSQAPNAAAEEFLRSGGIFPNATLIRCEVTKGSSRFNFYVSISRFTTRITVKTLQVNYKLCKLFVNLGGFIAKSALGFKSPTPLILTRGFYFKACIYLKPFSR